MPYINSAKAENASIASGVAFGLSATNFSVLNGPFNISPVYMAPAPPQYKYAVMARIHMEFKDERVIEFDIQDVSNRAALSWASGVLQTDLNAAVEDLSKWMYP